MNEYLATPAGEDRLRLEHRIGALQEKIRDLTAKESRLAERRRAALAEEWGMDAPFIGAGGSIPVAGYFKSILGMDSVLAGFAKDSDAIHSPNEKYDVDSFHRGIRSWARVLAKLG